MIVNPFTVSENLFLYYSCLCLEWRGVLGRAWGKMCMHLHVFIGTCWPRSNRKIYVLLEAGEWQITELIWMNLIKRNPVLLSGAVEYDTAWTGEHITK